MIAYSFQPNGRWFVFNVETGETIFKNASRASVRRYFYDTAPCLR